MINLQITALFRGGTERWEGERKGKRQGEKGEKNKDEGQSERIWRLAEDEQDGQRSKK